MTKMHTLIPAGESNLVLGLATSNNTLIAAGGQGRDYLKVASGNLDFKTKTSKGPGLRGAFANDSRIFVCGEYGHVAFSEDGGKRFEKAPGVKTSGCLFGLAEDTDGSIWTAGDKGYVARSEGGEGPVKFKKVAGVPSDIGRIRTSPLGVLIPTDAGELFIAHNKKIRQTSLNTSARLMAATVSAQNTIVVVGENAEIWRSSDEGESFTKSQVEFNNWFCGIAEAPEIGLLAVGFKGALFLSKDDGLTFEKLEHSFGKQNFWCAETHGQSILVGGENGFVFCLGERPQLDAVYTAAQDESHLPEILRSPPPSPEKKPEHVFESKETFKVAKVFVSDWLRSVLAPRRGGLYAPVRPLASEQVAWGQLRQALWANDAAHLAKEDTSGIWSLLRSREKEKRVLGAQILDDKAQSHSLEHDLFFQKLLYAKYRGFVGAYKHEALEWFAEFTLARLGLEAGAERILRGLDDELPYMRVGPFLRVRELLATCDEETYAKTKKTLLKTLDEEIEASQKGRRAAYLRWACTFILPMGPQSGDDEKALHEQALGHLKRFGDFGVHNAGLASGDANTLLKYREANHQENRHQFFDSAPRKMYLASLLEHAALNPKDHDTVTETLVQMKPSSPWEDDARYNGLWCMILAHIDDDRAREAIFNEHHRGREWGTWNLRLAHSFDAEAVRRFSKSEKVSQKPDELMLDFSLRDLSNDGLPFSGESIMAKGTPILEALPEGAPPTRFVYKRGERSFADAAYVAHDASTWNGQSIQ